MSCEYLENGPYDDPWNQNWIENDNYDSDKIDSDIEDMLYASIHHQTINSDELSFKSLKSNLDESMPTIFNERKIVNKKKIKESKNLKRKELMNSGETSQLKQEISTNQYNISYGNDIQLDFANTTTNGFYIEDNDDDNDDGDIDNVIKKLPKDRRYWKVDDKDLQFAFFSRRCSRNNQQKQCNYCTQYGHVERVCPNRTKRCYICGDDDHVQSSCDKKLICCYCFNTGHLSKNCTSLVRCQLCNIVGHHKDNCTNLWRQYLTIVNENDSVQIEKQQTRENQNTQLQNISCYNCGKSGSHFGYQCKSLTINHKRNEIPSPFLTTKITVKFNDDSKRFDSKRTIHKNNDDVEVDSDDSVQYLEHVLKQSTKTNKMNNVKKQQQQQQQRNYSLKNGLNKNLKKKKRMTTKNKITTKNKNGKISKNFNIDKNNLIDNEKLKNRIKKNKKKNKIKIKLNK